ncbi:MAG: flagellar hook-basal body protein [Lachnospiraceae bacterium]|nr:flagellar hook-basal body protein [Lachnospiraceae bacterium]
MLKGLYVASTGMVNEQRRVDVMTNNLANAATTGYKKEGTTAEAFHDVLALKIKDTSEPGVARRLGTMNLGVKIGENYTDFSQGPFHETENTFDMALSGSGFFAVEFTDKEGETSVKYTRDGSFTLNVKGELVNKNGDYLLDTNGNHIVLDPLQTYSIDRTGTVRQYDQNQALATVQVVDFENYDYLTKYGETYYEPVDGFEFAPANAQVYSGYLEASNVQTVSEMVSLIAYNRAYESNQKIIQAYDSTLDTAVNNVGRV